MKQIFISLLFIIIGVSISFTQLNAQDDHLNLETANASVEQKSLILDVFVVGFDSGPTIFASLGEVHCFTFL